MAIIRLTDYISPSVTCALTYSSAMFSWPGQHRPLLLIGATSYVGGRAGQASHLLFCTLFPTFLPIETGSVDVTGHSPEVGGPCDFTSAAHISAVFSINANVVIFCECPMYRLLLYTYESLEAKQISFTNFSFSLLKDLVHNYPKLIPEKHFIIKILNFRCENGLFKCGLQI